MAVEIGPSQLFAESEIQSAAVAVVAKFRDFKGCDLRRLSYDESVSDMLVDAYLTYGGHHDPPVAAENVIVLMSEFYAGPHAKPSLNRDTTYTWSWTLTRPGPGSTWVVVDWGYG